VTVFCKFLIFVFASFLTSPPLIGGEDDIVLGSLRGQIKTIGNGKSSRVAIFSRSGDDAEVFLCDSPVTANIRKASNFYVLIDGHQIEGEDKELKCFDPLTYKITFTSTHRPVIVGVVVKTESGFLISDEDGKDYKFIKLPAGLARKLSKKMIIELRQMESGISESGGYKVVSYSDRP
jgi:hypothetical protein